jgi:hypothetical protein
MIVCTAHTHYKGRIPYFHHIFLELIFLKHLCDNYVKVISSFIICYIIEVAASGAMYLSDFCYSDIILYCLLKQNK